MNDYEIQFLFCLFASTECVSPHRQQLDSPITVNFSERGSFSGSQAGSHFGSSAFEAEFDADVGENDGVLRLNKIRIEPHPKQLCKAAVSSDRTRCYDACSIPSTLTFFPPCRAVMRTRVRHICRSVRPRVVNLMRATDGAFSAKKRTAVFRRSARLSRRKYKMRNICAAKCNDRPLSEIVR